MNIPSRNFLYGGLSAPFIVESKVGTDRITLRTWQLSGDSQLQNLAEESEFSEVLNQHAEPFIVNMDPLGFRRSGRDVWVPLSALSGDYKCGERSTNLYVRPLSQMGFVIDQLLLGSGAWSDYAVWSFNATQSGRLELPFNRYIETRESKAHARLAIASRPSPVLLLYVPFAKDNFNHCSFVLQYNSAMGCIHNFSNFYQMPNVGSDWQILTPEQQFGVKGLLPLLLISGPDKISGGDSDNFYISLVDPESGSIIIDCPVYIRVESDSGYLPRRQALTTNGIATFTLSALGLSAGDRIKLKAGWRNYPGAAEKIVTVV